MSELLTDPSQLVAISKQIRMKSKTLKNALESESDLLTLMEISLEISSLSTEFRELLIAELTEQFKQKKPKSDKISERSD